MGHVIKKARWLAVAVVGAFAFAVIALKRGESVGAIWIIITSGPVYFCQAKRESGIFSVAGPAIPSIARTHKNPIRVPLRPSVKTASVSWLVIALFPAYSFFISCPPNWFRSADRSLLEKDSVSRDCKRCNNASVMTGAATSRSIASATVHRPSPESDT
jgi:hypothetical protein